MEGRGDDEASPPADDAARARAGETGVAHRRLNAVVVFLVDLTVKVVFIMFWHNLFSVIRLQWRNLQ